MEKDLRMRVVRVMLRAADRVSPRLAATVAFRLFNTPVGARDDLLRGAAREHSREILSRAEALDMAIGKRTVRLYRWRRPGSAEDRMRSIPRRRRTVLLTHGWTLGARYMTAFVDPLLQADFDVVALDFPGHGASSDTRSPAQDAVRSIRAADDFVGGFYALVGHSFGGSMSVLAAEGAPPLNGALAVDRLVLIGSGDRLTDTLDRFAHVFGLSASARARLDRKIQKMGKRPVAEISTSRILPRLGVPTLVVHDPADRLVPFADAERIAALPRVKLLKAEGLGHFRLLRSARVVDAVVSFLR